VADSLPAPNSTAATIATLIIYFYHHYWTSA